MRKPCNDLQHSGMDWNDHAVSTLRTLWNDGHSTA